MVEVAGRLLLIMEVHWVSLTSFHFRCKTGVDILSKSMWAHGSFFLSFSSTIIIVLSLSGGRIRKNKASVLTENTGSISSVTNHNNTRSSRHMHHNSAIKIFRHLSHHPPVVNQIHLRTWPVYMAIRRLLHCCCLSDVVHQWISLHLSTDASTLRRTSEGPLMKAPYVISNWIFTPVSCLLRSRAVGGSHNPHTQGT